MRILMLGDVNGSPGRRMLKTHLKRLKTELGLAAAVVNAENAAAGNGILTRQHGEKIIDSITGKFHRLIL